MKALPSKFLVLSLAVTGALTLVVLAKPALVVLGIWLLILPGLILAITPTVFLYLCAFSVGWFAVIRHGKLPAMMTGAVCIVLLGIGVPSLMNASTAPASRLSIPLFAFPNGDFTSPDSWHWYWGGRGPTNGFWSYRRRTGGTIAHPPKFRQIDADAFEERGHRRVSERRDKPACSRE